MRLMNSRGQDYRSRSAAEMIRRRVVSEGHVVAAISGSGPEWPLTLDLSGYFGRINYRGAAEPNPAVAQDLVTAHTRTIPFENLDPVMGVPVDDLSPAALTDKPPRNSLDDTTRRHDRHRPNQAIRPVVPSRCPGRGLPGRIGRRKVSGGHGGAAGVPPRQQMG
jgi:hypothetical protein